MLRRFRSDARGVAAVEFALTGPILALMYCGLAEFSLAFLAERRAAHVAAVVSDLVSQPSQLTTAQVDDIFNVAAPLMRPFSSATLTLRVSSFKADATGVPRVVWSRGHGMTALAANATTSKIPAGLLLPGEVRILTETSYSYDGAIGTVLPDALTFESAAINSARKNVVTLN